MHSRRANSAGTAGKPGTLYVVATPIGNLGDITLRALETLRSVHLIAAEDTRHTRKLLAHYDIRKPLVSYHSHNMLQRGPELIRRIGMGEDVALVSDAGTPGVSDPGSLLIDQAIESGLPVVVIPGPAALIAALVASGLPTDSFAFLGFAPSRGSGRKRFFASRAELPMTLILYESPQRLHRTLDDILSCWGDRRIAVARELTKHFEEIFRGTVSEGKEHFSTGVKGELTLVVAGAADEAKTKEPSSTWPEELARLLTEPGTTLKQATEQISARFNVSRRTVYREALKIKGQRAKG